MNWLSWEILGSFSSRECMDSMVDNEHATKQPMGQERKRKSENTWDKWKWKHKIPKSMGCSKNSSKKVYKMIGLPQETKFWI